MIGDQINDEYVYVTPLGMSAKENILAVRAEAVETYEGGVKAAAAHVKGFCGYVAIAYGPHITVKRRFVERTQMRKLFEVHDSKAGHGEWPWGHFDVTIVTDFGHGFIDNPQDICSLDTFLAVNAQTNSANRGFNLITKYPRADYVVLDGLEARLATQDRYSPIEEVIRKLGFKRLVVTLGHEGCVGYDGDFYYAPSVARSVVDTMGAGDAFFSITAPFAAAGASMPELLAIGNAAGAIKCGAVGQKAVDRASLVQQLGLGVGV